MPTSGLSIPILLIHQSSMLTLLISVAVRNTPLPPSVEKAYQKKCVELKRRLLEIEEANDDARLRKRRVDRAIMKMRLERAFLLDRLAKSQHLNADDSDKSTSPPPTVRRSRTLARFCALPALSRNNSRSQTDAQHRKVTPGLIPSLTASRAGSPPETSLQKPSTPGCSPPRISLSSRPVSAGRDG